MTHCFNCGSQFEGRPNRLYCSARCRKQVEYRRRRRVELEGRAASLERLCDMARANSDRHAQRFQEWHLSHVRSQLELLGPS